jgi:EmrB/QacA subfamily drug resistance transporter
VTHDTLPEPTDLQPSMGGVWGDPTRRDEFPAASRSYPRTLKRRPDDVTEPSSTAEAKSDHGDNSRWLALYVLCGGLLMIVLDATVVNVALPTIKDDLGFSQSNLAWVVNAYLIAFGGLLLLAGRLGDLIGQRKIFLIGLTVFTGASLLCALSQSQAMLIGARFVQGAGGAIGSAVILGMIVIMFPEPREQAKAIGVFAFIASAGASIGLLAGGVITEAISWHWIFAINVPIGVAIAFLARRLVPDREGIGLDQGADVPGAVLLTGGLMLGVYTLLEAGEKGWGSLHTLGLGALAIGLIAIFVARQARIETPLMPLRLFRSRNVAGANLVMGLLVVGFFGQFFLGALYMQEILGYSPLGVGFAFLPSCLVMGTLSLRYAEKLIMGIGARSALIAGLSLCVVGLLLFARTPVDGNYLTDIFPVMLLLGAGAGTCFPALMTLAMSGATQEDAGLASGLVNTTTQVGGAIGLAVLATAAAERTDALAGSMSHDAALNSGYHLAYLIGSALMAAAVLVAVVVVRAVPAQAAGSGEGSEPAAAPEGDRAGEPAYSEVA